MSYPLEITVSNSLIASALGADYSSPSGVVQLRMLHEGAGSRPLFVMFTYGFESGLGLLAPPLGTVMNLRSPKGRRLVAETLRRACARTAVPIGIEPAPRYGQSAPASKRTVIDSAFDPDRDWQYLAFID